VQAAHCDREFGLVDDVRGDAERLVELRCHERDAARVPVGDGSAKVSIADTDAGGFYLLAVTLATFIPAGKVKQVYEAFSGLVKELVAVFGRYRDCLAGANWISQVGCHGRLQWDVTYALGRATVLGLGKAVVSVLLDGAFYLKFLDAQVPAISKIVHSTRTIAISAKTGGGRATTQPPRTQPGTTPTSGGGSTAVTALKVTITPYTVHCPDAPAAIVAVASYPGYTGPPVTVTLVVDGATRDTARIDPNGQDGAINHQWTNLQIPSGSGSIKVTAKGVTIGSKTLTGIC
jgi:hypothetical protein